MLPEVKIYQTNLDRRTTEKALRQVKDYFKSTLSHNLELEEVSAPMTVVHGTGINDDLNGVEKPVQFTSPDFDGSMLEIVQSLAKWKRLKLGELGIKEGKGIITHMHALRPDEHLSHIHSIFVDQWDWEKVISRADRSIDFLKSTVSKIYDALVNTERYISMLYPEISPVLPPSIKFIQSEDLLKMYPGATPKERETLAAKEFGIVFIIGIGHALSDGVPHDLRAPDYDDWSVQSEETYKGLNGDILLWHPTLEQAFEISSMGIRVDKEALQRQLKITGTEERSRLPFHHKLLTERLPLSIGGGIGQSRLCMFMLRKVHIGEVQASIWPEEVKRQCADRNIQLL